MAALGRYAVTVASAAILCGIILSLVQGNGQKEILKLLCGVFLTVTALSPFTRLSLPDLSDIALAESLQGSEVAAQGEIIAREAMADIIKSETEEYILDKAAALSMELEVQVLIRDGIPSAVHLHGNAPPHRIKQLERIITEELGISKENLRWTGRS